MGEEIRGLSVKFDADFSEFKKGLKSADKDINSTQKQLKTLKESLKLEWDSRKFSQAQQQAQKALEATEKKAELLRDRLASMESVGITDETRDQYNYLSQELEKAELNGKKLQKQLEEIDDIRLSHLTSGIDTVSSKLNTASKATRALSIASTAALVGIGALSLESVKQADEIATLATKYSMTTDAIQRFNYVALQTDTSSEDLYKGFVKVQAGVADLSQGIDSISTKALEKLGLDFKSFDGTEDQFYAIVDALSKMEDKTQMVSIANDLFGEKLATNIFPLIYAGTDAINEYREEFEMMGALTQEEVQELAEFDNVLNKVKTSFANTSVRLGSAFLPIMERFAEILETSIIPMLQEVVDWFSSLDSGTQEFIVTVLLLTAVLSPMLKMFSNVASSVSSLITWFVKMDAATLSLYGKVALLAAALGTLFYVLANWSNMNPVQKIIGLLGALSAAALAAAVAFGVFHSAWSIGIAVAGITAGIAAAVLAVQSAAEDIGAEVSFDANSYATSVDIPSYDIPEYSDSGSSITNNDNSYTDNSNVIINIEKNDYMTEDDIIEAVNKGLKKARQARS